MSQRKGLELEVALFFSCTRTFFFLTREVEICFVLVSFFFVLEKRRGRRRCRCERLSPRKLHRFSAHLFSLPSAALALSRLLAQRCRGPWRRAQSQRRSELLLLPLRPRPAAIGDDNASSRPCRRRRQRRLDQCSSRRGASRLFLTARGRQDPSLLCLMATTTMT